ncbi:ABC transporter ATP-binding protein [Psychromonas algicola]|uniref:ABC transporter ATP-binding protein n=1 Tax=Psychromonas algicola TaxID=2555642 RepID=UPI0010675B5C|nr:ATP-binding cassette domain-containing protein [Psychromonas sp. RZ5]TEW49268.1 ATP-binding cassette domain-containing protein [Psychromonas sp. RZ5]
METVIEGKRLKKTFKISKREKGLFGHLANLFLPKYIHKKAVDDISFTIKKGDAVGFIGANGAGKSTTIKMLSGILSPTEGSVTALGLSPDKDRIEYVAKIGAIFGQKSQLSWDLPIIDSFDLLQKIYRIPDQKYQENLAMFTKILDMKSFIEQPVRQLSLGQRMRADIAAALLHSPELVFFDEPTIGLDVVAKEKIREFIRYMNKELGVTIIFTTHDMQDIEKTCERLIIIDQGKKIYDGTVAGIKTHFGSERKLVVKFEQDYDISEVAKTPSIKIISKKDRSKEFLFKNEDIEVKSLIQYLFENYQVSDLTISEPDIEEIVRDIYDKGI